MRQSARAPCRIFLSIIVIPSEVEGPLLLLSLAASSSALIKLGILRQAQDDKDNTALSMVKQQYPIISALGSIYRAIVRPSSPPRSGRRTGISRPATSAAG